MRVLAFPMFLLTCVSVLLVSVVVAVGVVQIRSLAISLGLLARLAAALSRHCLHLQRLVAPLLTMLPPSVGLNDVHDGQYLLWSFSPTLILL